VGGIAEASRTATSPAGTTFTATFGGKPIIYTLSGSGSAFFPWDNLDFSGTPNDAEKRLSAVLEILDMPTATEPGSAVISVAWPAQARPVWNSDNQTWDKAEGSLTSSILFLPKL
jgi:hypothetical protein